MKFFELEVTGRKALGKKDAKSLRKNNQVPCVIYGGKETLHFYTEERAFKDLVYTNQVYIVNLNLDGRTIKCIIKELQFHPVTDRLNHIDFYEVSDNKPIIIHIPVEIVGNSAGIRAGGKLRQRKRYLKVKGLIEKLPDTLVIDISNLEIGHSILAGDLKYDNVEIHEPPRALVVGVISARAALKEAEEGAAGATAEGAGAESAPAAAGATGKAEAQAEGKK
jgi:large subunit ribosomal protein L25